MQKIGFTVLVALSLIRLAISSTATEAPVVPRWQPHDFEFAARTNSANPFFVAFEATVTAPDGKSGSATFVMGNKLGHRA